MDDTQQDIRTVLGMDDRRHRRLGRWALAAAALLALAGGAWAWRSWRGGAEAPAYVTVPAARGDLTVTVTATGSVEPTTLVDISSELSGTLSEVLVDYNDSVHAGQELARLDTSELEARVAVQRANLRAAEAQISRAEATLSETREAFDRAKALDARGVITETDRTTAGAAFARAQAELEVATANRAQAEANLRLSETQLAKACICAPIDGVVLDRKADPGQIVAASLSAPVLFTVAGDLSEMELQVAVDEADIGRLSPGDRATFTVDAYPDRDFPARISRIRYASQTVEGVVTYLATLDVPNKDLALRPGMTATAEIVVAEIHDALLVPNAALRYAPPAAPEPQADTRSGLLGMLMPRHAEAPPTRRAPRSVWVLRDGRPTEIPVEPGDTDGRRTEIRSGALAEGDAVITAQAG